jgi:hypothetical protein
MSIISTGALGYVAFSVYYQAAVIKKWCPLCLGVQLVFIADFTILYEHLLPIDLSCILAVKFLLIATTVCICEILYKGFTKVKQDLQEEKLAYLKIKKNPEIFINLLYRGKQATHNNTEEFFAVGDQTAPIVITAFLSLDCAACQTMFGYINELLNHRDIRVNLVFLFHIKDMTFTNHLTRVLKEGKEQEAIRLLNSWYSDRSDNLGYITELADKSDADFFEKTQTAHKHFFKRAKVTVTPALFINSYSLPNGYQVRDILYFIDALKAYKD